MRKKASNVNQQNSVATEMDTKLTVKLMILFETITKKFMQASKILASLLFAYIIFFTNIIFYWYAIKSKADNTVCVSVSIFSIVFYIVVQLVKKNEQDVS